VVNVLEGVVGVDEATVAGAVEADATPGRHWE